MTRNRWKLSLWVKKYTNLTLITLITFSVLLFFFLILKKSIINRPKRPEFEEQLRGMMEVV